MRPRDTRDLSPAEAGRLIGLSGRCIRQAVDKGTLRAYRVPGSRHRRVRLADLRAWCNRNSIPFGVSDSEEWDGGQDQDRDRAA